MSELFFLFGAFFYDRPKRTRHSGASFRLERSIKRVVCPDVAQPHSFLPPLIPLTPLPCQPPYMIHDTV